MAMRMGASLLQTEHAPIIGSRNPSHEGQDLRPRVSNAFTGSGSPCRTAWARVTTTAAPSQELFQLPAIALAAEAGSRASTASCARLLRTSFIHGE